MKEHADELFKNQPKRIQKLNKDGQKQIREKKRKEWWRNFGGGK
jgi:hypothetical protein